jgi:peptidyl-prolyl cis-trans isomerase A (cyclophilin A)
MSSFPRPTGLASFNPNPAAPRPVSSAVDLRFNFVPAVCTAALLIGCPASPPGADKGDKQVRATASKTVDGKSVKAPTVVKATASGDCCQYCFAGTPCGNECLPEGKSCDKPEGSGCACNEDKREAKQFPKNFRLGGGTGLLAPDVFNYNKSQGDPFEGPFTLEMAFEGAPELADKTKGKLTAVFTTSKGTFECELYEEQAPLTVANFVGLARGVRPFKDPRDRKATEWKKARYYDGTKFHRVIKDFMIQGGDPTATGHGTPGYFVPDEFDPKLRHDGPGYLSMANRNPYDQLTNKPIYDEKTGLTVGNTGSAQFFVTVRETSALNDRHTIFGKCATELPIEISKVETLSNPIPDMPREDVVIEKLDFVRK